MAVDVHKVNFLITAQDAASQVFRGARANLERLDGTYRRFTALLGGVGAAMLVRQMAQAQMEAERASARLDAVLTATGYSAGLTRAALERMNDELVRTTQFDDESIRNAQSQFLKFGNIQQQVFERGIKLAADYAAFTGSEIPEAAQAIGRALQSPTQGVMLLERQIGRLTFAQKEQIRTLMEQGRLQEAQTVILDLLQGKIGGVAQAMNTGLNGAVRAVTKNWGDLMEEMGRTDAVLAPLQGLAALLKDIELTIKGTRNPLSDLLNDILDFGDRIPGLHRWVSPLARSRLPSRTSVSGEIRGASAQAEAAAAQAAAVTRLQAMLDAAQERAAEAAKKRAADAERRLAQFRGAEEALAREIFMVNERTRVEQVLFDIEQGRFREFLPAQQRRLVALAQEFDATRKLRDAEEEAARERQRRNQEHERAKLAFANEIGAMRTKYLDMINPTAEMLRQWEEIERLERLGPGLGLSPQQAIDAKQLLMQRFEEAQRRLNNEIARGVDVWRDFGWSASSALERVIFEGGRARDVIQALLRDIAQIYVRQQITNPLAGAASSFMKMIFANLPQQAPAPVVDLSPRQHGGPFDAGQPLLVGERGPEAVLFNRPGNVVPNHKLGGGDTYIIDARGADSAAIARLERVIIELNGSIERRAVAAVADARARGGISSIA